MISKINRIKSLGLVFADFRWPAGTPTFKKVNLIYGWNGCGKTTLTRLFDDLNSADPEGDLEYEVEAADGRSFERSEAFPQRVRVFNQHYVDANLRVLDSSTNKISILLGEGNQELLSEIRADEALLQGVLGDPSAPGLLAELKGFTEKKRRKEKENESAFTEIAKTISAGTTGAGLATRSYRAPDAKRDFEKLTEAALLSEADLREGILSLRQEQLPEVPPLRAPFTEDFGDVLESLLSCQDAAHRLVPITVEAQVIERLASNPGISAWVEEGSRIHAAHSSEACEYCGSVVPAERIKALARHFNEADQELKRELDGLVAPLRAAFSSLDKYSPPDAVHVYPELREEYVQASVALLGHVGALVEQVVALGKAVQAKKASTTEVVHLQTKIDRADFDQALATLNAVLKRHNERSQDFQALKAQTSAAIRTHYLSTIFDAVTERSRQLADLGSDLERRALEISTLQDRIAANRARISSDHRACDDINAALSTFLGRQELRFVPQEVEAGLDGAGTVTGYRIMRGDVPATHLSEGERTAIAFVYFVVHLRDGQFDPATSIIVVDDPISSLDSNSLYQAFSFLKNAVQDGGQVFVLTHNFDFLKLLLNWRSRAKKNTGYFMISNQVVGGVRRASIEPMDRELCDYESEYHYLFKTLKRMRQDQNGTLAQAYPVPNIARKVWETFLMFRVPDGGSPHSKANSLKEAGFDATKLDAIYKFTNDNSHMTGAGFSPALVQETTKVLDELFEMMETISPDHFRILDQATP